MGAPAAPTPQYHHAVAVAGAGADIIAIDATQRPRPGEETLGDLVARIHAELERPVMADVDTLEAAIAAVAAGADHVGTTLYGYTAETSSKTPPGLDLLRQLVNLGVPAICEGGIASPQMARQAIDLGAHSVVVGTAITAMDALAATYVSALKE